MEIQSAIPDNTNTQSTTSAIRNSGKNNRHNRRILFDNMMRKVVRICTLFSPLLLILIITGLVIKSLPLLGQNSIFDLLLASDFKPLDGKFGLLPFVLSTIYVTIISVVIAIPLSILTAVYLSEYADKHFLKFAAPMLDILSGIPSVIYGIWGVLVIVPFIRDVLGPWMGIETSGYSILAGGIVLAIMVFPVIIQIVYEVMRTVPHELREATLSLGATKWETIRKVVLKKASPGITAACILGFSRAFGETIAVLMVVGNMIQIPGGILDAGYPIPSLIANNYGEMMSIPMYDSVLMFAALVLLIIVLVFNVYSRWVLNRLEKKLN